MKSKRKSKKSAVTQPVYNPHMRHKAALKHTHRQTILFNDPETDAIKEYCRRFGIKAKAPVLRRIIMEAVLEGLDETQPTLF